MFGNGREDCRIIERKKYNKKSNGMEVFTQEIEGCTGLSEKLNLEKFCLFHNFFGALE